MSTETPQASSLLRSQWYTHPYDGAKLYQLVAMLAPRLPRGFRFACARIIADLYRRRMPTEYAAAQRNLSRILPAASSSTIPHVARSLFRHFAYYFADLFSLNRQPLAIQQRYLHTVHNLDCIEPFLKSNQGIVVATAHLGNWELAGRLLSSYGKMTHVVRAPDRDATVHKLLREGSDSSSLRFVVNDDTGGFVQLLMALRRGDVVAFQIDRGTGHRSDVAVNFFGAPVSLPSGPFILARAAQVPVFPCFCIMRPDWRYEIYLGEAIFAERGSEETALQQMVRVLERHITLAPDQWFSFYDVWDNTKTIH